MRSEQEVAAMRIVVMLGLCVLLGACGCGPGSLTTAPPSGQVAISVSPTSPNFGNQVVGTTSAAQGVTVSNVGTAALSISNVSITISEFKLQSVPTVPVTVNPGASVTFMVVFAPDAAKAFSGQLTLTSNASGSPTVVPLTGMGVAANGPVVNVSPTSLAFGNQAVGTTSAAQGVTVSNTGTAALSISNVSITISEFKLQSVPTMPVTVNPGASVTLMVVFAPDAAKAFSGQLTLTSNAPGSPTVVSLTGAGVSSSTVVNVNPTSLAFGNQSVGTTSAANNVTVANGGTTTITVTSVSTAAPFAVSGFSGPTTLAAGKSLALNVTFAPTTSGPFNGALTISYDVLPNTIVPLSGTGMTSNVFQATPLIDFASGQLYLGTFPGLLYDASNTPPSDHDADGKTFASQIVPINGKIVVIGIGMSNWTKELCVPGSELDPTTGTLNTCNSYTFMGQAAASSSVNHTTLVLVDCAADGAVATGWAHVNGAGWGNCVQLLGKLGLTPDQVQVVLYKDAIGFPTNSLIPTTVCQPLADPFQPPANTPDACLFETYVALTARNAKVNFPNVKQMFLHSRIYAGYCSPSFTLNPEPFAYEYGFATKWLLQAQINQRRGLGVNSVAGDLDYSVAPWLAWGPYFWASDDTPRSDGLTWVPTDYGDCVHPSVSGVTKVANMMMQFYVNSAYTPWFRAQ